MHIKSRHSLVCLFSLASILTLLTQPAVAENSPDSNSLTATDIIKRMKSAYVNSRSYLDTGMVEEIFIDANGERTVEKPFTTAFVRPDRFRYEFRETPPYQWERRFVIHQNGNELRTHWDVDHDLKMNTLDRAVAAATGVSSESAITVPGMLLPKEITWRRAIRFRTPRRIDDAILKEIDCYRIIDRVGGGLITFWISKQDFLLRKTYLEKSFGDFRVERTTTYKPEINTEVDAELLEFNPSGNKPWWRI